MPSGTGLFIAFEGPEGVGKTTQIARLRDRLAGLGKDVVLTREPGGTASGEALRALLLDPERDWSPLGEALLMNAARDAHVQQVILPALGQGQIVLCDRFSLSTRAYQGAGGVAPETLRQLEAAVVPQAPDLTLVFDLSPDEGLRRAEARGTADRFEAKPASYHRAVHEHFLAEAASEGLPVIDASGDVDSVEQRVWAAVHAALAARL